MSTEDARTTEPELDVRNLRKPDRHPRIFAAYDALEVGGVLILVNDHDPRHLREEFETEHPGSYGWEYLSQEPSEWRIRISKLASSPQPRILCDTGALASSGEPDAAGAVWKLEMHNRDLDSNVIALPPGGTIEDHAGPEIDVLIHVLAGSGTLASERAGLELTPGALLWLPRRARRGFTAGPRGLRYLTVHQRRQALSLQPAPPAPAG
jgi:uncharacterized protein (DUF2249 family)/quercetin dioxygenase-like cupin family protein